MIKALLGLTRMLANEILERAKAVYAGMNGNPHFPDPPVKMPAFKAAIDSLSAALVEALDASRTAIAIKNKQLDVVKKMLRQLVIYVEQHVEAEYTDNEAVFLSSGLEIAPNSRPAPPPLSKFIRRIEHGPNSGQLWFTLVAVTGASLYELRWAPVGTSEKDGVWASQLITKTRPATLIRNLVPGTNYVFQVRAMIGSAFTDWSDPVTRICT